MNILTIFQYNQGISRSKILSSTSGVGSVITTKAGYYILISDINQWRFITAVQKEITKVRAEFRAAEWYEKAKNWTKDLGLSTIDDPRFILFLKGEKELSNLLCLIAIPHLSLNDHYNTVNAQNNPIIKKLKAVDNKIATEDFMVLGTHFPKWFKNRGGELQLYSTWLERWKKANIKAKFFAPPRDANDPIRGADKQPLPARKIKDGEGIEEKVVLYHQLTQLNLGLICPNGHLSDIPWSKFLKWKSDRGGGKDKGERLLSYESCCPNPKLKWSESTTKSEGYASIYIECVHCHKKENLEGINNLAPYCLGEKPWQVKIDGDDHTIPRDISCKGIHGMDQKMQVALVTGNNMYFANGFSSLYIPQYLIDGIDERVALVLDVYEKKYQRYLEFAPSDSRDDFQRKMMTPEKLVSDGYNQYLQQIPGFCEKLSNLFLGEKAIVIENTHEHYRWQEYQCFLKNACSPEGLADLSFKDIKLSDRLASYFVKVQQVDELKVCQVQLDFTRVKPNERVIRENQIVNSTEGQNIFSLEKNELFVLPANEIFGEGLFFAFNEEAIASWYEINEGILSKRLQELIGTYNEQSPGAGPKQVILSDGLKGAKFLLIHTFSHLLMRELEFSCGYPTASLKERLFISDRMAGVLIYTAEGAEGSMGGLVWQGQPDKVEELLKNALHRAFDCSSDPLCWESDGQGLFNLNLAACFSCSLVSETACEEWNLGLDRRVLIDPEFGFFYELLNRMLNNHPNE